jgi:hypothetical protein
MLQFSKINMKPIRRPELADLILMLAIAIGTFMRFNPTLLAGFAINDGGMFSVMVDDLKASHYVLPAFTSYNHLNIPFAYPPLGFYLGRIASDLFGLSAPEALRWVPAFFASLSMPAFYLLALRLVKDKYRAALSTLFFAFMPRAFESFVMGGGITRSPGQFFMLLTLLTLVRLYEENRRADIFWSGLFGGLAVMSHPEAAVFTFLFALLLWWMRSRTAQTLFASLGVAVVVAIVTAPWWGTVIHYHGVQPFLNALATGQKSLAWSHLLFFAFTAEPYASIIAVLGLIGIAQRLLFRDWLLPLWMALPFIVGGRNAADPAAIPLAMLAGIGLADVVLPAFQARFAPGQSSMELQDQVSSVERNILIYILLYLIFSTYQFGLQLSNATVYPPDQEAMSWVHEETPSAARFLVLTGTSSVSCDSVIEWFPALTDRQSILTVQGTEWSKGPKFNDYVKSTYAVQECLAGGDAPCLDSAVHRSAYDYIYLSRKLRANSCISLGIPRTFPYFEEHIRMDSGFAIIYETDGVVIFKKR